MVLRSDDDIDGSSYTQKIKADDLANPPFDAVSVDCRATPLRHYDAKTRMCQRGGKCADVEVLGPSTPPLTYNIRQVSLTRQLMAARKAVALRRRRILMAVGPLNAFGPSCDGG